MRQRVALGRIMDSRRKLLFRVTSKTLGVVVEVGVEAAMDRHILTRRSMPRVMAVAEAGEDFQVSPIFLACRVNFPTCSVVLGTEKERALRMHLPNLAPMPRCTHLPNHHTATHRIGLFHRNHG